jgi:hypothetical protein
VIAIRYSLSLILVEKDENYTAITSRHNYSIVRQFAENIYNYALQSFEIYQNPFKNGFN